MLDKMMNATFEGTMMVAPTLTQAAVNEYIRVIEAISDLLTGAHNPTMTAQGQNLMPMVLAFCRFGVLTFPVGTPIHDTCLRMIEKVQSQVVGKNAKQRSG